MTLKVDAKAWRICPREGCDASAPVGHPCLSCGTPDRPDVHRLSDDYKGIWSTEHGRPIPGWCSVCGGPLDQRGECPRIGKHGASGTDARTREAGRGGASSMALKVKCPTCAAKMGTPCLSIANGKSTRTHKARKDRARVVVLGKGAA